MNDEEGHIDADAAIALLIEKTREEGIRMAGMVDWRDTPFPRGDTKFMLFMSAEEWELAYVMSLAWIDQGELKAVPVAEQFRAVIYRLQQQYGYTWEGLRQAEDGELYATVRKPVEGNNILSIMLLQGGDPPEYEIHIINAVDYCRIREPLVPLVPLLKETMARVRLAIKKTPWPSKKEQKFLRKKMRFEQRAARALKNKIMEAEIIN